MNTIFKNITTEAGYGAALVAYGGKKILLHNCLFEDNSGNMVGAGFSAFSIDDIIITNSDFYRQKNKNDPGANIYLSGEKNVYIDFC